MNVIKTLEHIGLEEKEAKTYIALLTLGETTATRIAEKAMLDRTLMYQLLNKLIEKGLASYVIKNNVKYFLAAEPQILLEDLEQKKSELKEAIPLLNKQRQSQEEETKVEVYKGRKGIYTIIRMIVTENTPYYAIGGLQQAYSEFEAENLAVMRQLEKKNIQGKMIVRTKDDFHIGTNEDYRYVPETMIASTTTMILGNKVITFVWSKPYHAILIENEEVARSNKSTFDYLWSIAQKPTKEDREEKLNKKSF